MDHDRRRVLLLAAAAFTSSGLRRASATETAPTFALKALTIGAADGGAPPRLGYRKETGPPILRMKTDETVRVTLRNGLGEATAFAVHGLRAGGIVTPSHGLLDPPLAPDATVSIDLRPTESGTAWFHPPFMPGWSDQTARGLAGVILVEEAIPPQVDDDVVLFLGDRSAAGIGGLADRLFVNGKAWPERRAYRPGSRLRLRIVNGSTRVALTASFGGVPAMVIAIDGQPSELFRPLNDSLPIGPGARFDVLVDLPKAERGDGTAFALTLAGIEASGPTALSPVFVVTLAGDAKADRSPIAALPPNPSLPRAIPLETATRVELMIQAVGRPPGSAAFAINGSASIDLPKAPLFRAKRNTTVSIGVANRTADLIGLHVHGQAMRVLHALDDGWEPYWRDSILVPPGKTFHVAFVADTAGRFLIDSPFFDQATTGLRRWFEIV